MEMIRTVEPERTAVAPPGIEPQSPPRFEVISNPHRLARRFARRRPQLQFVAGHFYEREGTSRCNLNDVRAELSRFLDREFRIFSRKWTAFHREWFTFHNNRSRNPPVSRPQPVTSSTVSNVLDALKSVCFERYTTSKRRVEPSPTAQGIRGQN